MKNLRKSLFLLIFFSLVASMSGSAQNDGVISAKSLRSQVEFLSDQLCAGRGVESAGGMEAAFWITRQMLRHEVLPFDGTYMRSSRVSGRRVSNVVGIVPADTPSDRYIVVSAHYDNLGTLNGNYYPGADSNASGVAAMLGVAQALRASRVMGESVPVNYIFVALDAKQANMQGAECFYKDIANGRLRNPATGSVIKQHQVRLFVNIDIIGGVQAPISKGRSRYMIMLGADEGQRCMLRDANQRTDAGLQLGFDYYGSKNFTDLFYRRISDQKVFLSHGVPCVMFTSGITMDTNTVGDSADKLDFDVMRARVRTICAWLKAVSYAK